MEGMMGNDPTRTLRVPAAEIRPGQTVAGKYRIVGKLGRGGMGVVYEAEDLRLERKVALKFLPAALTADPEARERFIHEARTASSLDHPNICTIHDVDETADGGPSTRTAWRRSSTSVWPSWPARPG